MPRRGRCRASRATTIAACIEAPVAALGVARGPQTCGVGPQPPRPGMCGGGRTLDLLEGNEDGRIWMR